MCHWFRWLLKMQSGILELESIGSSSKFRWLLKMQSGILAYGFGESVIAVPVAPQNAIGYTERRRWTECSYVPVAPQNAIGYTESIRSVAFAWFRWLLKMQSGILSTDFLSLVLRVPVAPQNAIGYT